MDVRSDSPPQYSRRMSSSLDVMLRRGVSSPISWERCGVARSIPPEVKAPLRFIDAARSSAVCRRTRIYRMCQRSGSACCTWRSSASAQRIRSSAIA
eukprot:1148593-Prymnesium_polylepis.2